MTAAARHSELPPPAETIRVQIVDDDRDFADSLAELVALHGYVVDAAYDVDRALARAAEFAPDIALIDLRLGSASGLDLIPALRHLVPNIMCVLMTGHAETDTAIEAVRLGAHEYLRKPVAEREILATLASCGERLRLRRDKAAAEAALRESETNFRAVLDNSPAAVFLQDGDGCLMLANKRFGEWFGIAPEEALGQSARDLFGPAQAAAAAAHEEAVLAAGEAVEREAEFSFADGARHRVVITRFPVFDGIGGVCVDVTGQRDLEERLRQALKMEAVGRLTGGVAHEFNNLLAVIVGSVELAMERGPGEPGTAPLLARALAAADRGAALTQRLLTFSRKQNLRPQRVEPRAFIAGMAGSLAGALGETIEVRTRFEKGVSACEADPVQLESAILNLAANAGDAMPAGGRLTIAAANAALDDETAARFEVAPGDYVVFTVRDRGPGMPAVVAERAFEPFFTTKEIGEGEGLGLSMVFGFAKQSGGHAAIESREGKGTAVRLYLPRWLPRRDADARPDGGSVLLVDDDPAVRRSIVRLLESLGYTVAQAGGGRAALDLIDEGPAFDLLLTEVVLSGGMTGKDLAAEARRRVPGLEVVYTSGYTDNAIPRDARPGKGVELLYKPFRKADLAGRLRKVLGGQERDR